MLRLQGKTLRHPASASAYHLKASICLCASQMRPGLSTGVCRIAWRPCHPHPSSACASSLYCCEPLKSIRNTTANRPLSAKSGKLVGKLSTDRVNIAYPVALLASIHAVPAFPRSECLNNNGNAIPAGKKQAFCINPTPSRLACFFLHFTLSR